MKKLYSFLFVVFSFTGISALRAQDSTRCNASFTASVNITQVYFAAFDSLSGVMHRWDFGDGSTLVTYSGVVSHQYLSAGRYLVIQVVTDSSNNCSNSASQNITIGPNCAVGINFSSDTSGHHYTFVANVFSDPGVADTLVWTINDSLAGQGDTLRKFLPGGPYNICAHLRTGDGCQSQSCLAINPQDSIGALPPPPDTCSISINAVAAAHRSGEYNFSVADSAKYDGVNWSILAPDSGRMGPFPGPEFSYTFQDTGFYLISVTALELSGCPVSANQWLHVDSLSAEEGNFVSSYPNPASTQVTLAVTLTATTSINIRVFNSMGGLALTRIQSGYPGINQVIVPVADLPTGVYYIELQYGDTVVKSKIQKL